MNLLLATLVILGLVLNAQTASITSSSSQSVSGSSSGSITGTVSISVSWSLTTSVSASASTSITPSGTPDSTPTPSGSPSQSKALSVSRSGSGSISPSTQRVVAPGCDCDPAFDSCCNADCSFKNPGDLCGTQLQAGDCYVATQCARSATVGLECLAHYKVAGDKCTPTGTTQNNGICSRTGVCFSPLNPRQNPVKVGPAIKRVAKRGKGSFKDEPFRLPSRKSSRRSARNRKLRRRKTSKKNRKNRRNRRN